MNVKKAILSVLAVLLSAGAFAYPAPQDEAPVTSLLQQYAAQIQELQQGFNQKLLPAIKNIATLALQAQTAGQTDLTPEQSALLEKYTLELDKSLTGLAAPAVKDLDINQFNEQYAQMANTYGLPAQKFTQQEVTDLFKGMYLVSALGYFEQTQKLSTEELTVLMELFFSQEEGETIIN